MQLQELHFCFHPASKISGCHRESEDIVSVFLSVDIFAPCLELVICILNGQ